jgi:hypothetical protein
MPPDPKVNISEVLTYFSMNIEVNYPLPLPIERVYFTSVISTMELHTLKNVNNCLNTNIYSYLETSGGQSLNPYLNVVHFFNTRVN